MTYIQKFTSKRLFSLVIVIAFVTVAFFGVHLAMNMDSQGMMKNCPFMGHMKNVCTMTVTEHIANVPSRKFLFAALLLMSFTYAAFLFQFSLFNKLNFSVFRSGAGPPEYSSGFLLRALGRGILRKRE